MLCVFCLVYLGMALGRLPGLGLDRAGIALCGAALMLAAGALPPESWTQALDLESLVLLFALMLVAGHFAEARVFDALAHRLASSQRGPHALLAAVVALGGGLSAMLVNDIVVFALVPLLVRGCSARGLDSRPYLLALALASNAGSAASLVGNPQNLLIGEIGELDFLAYSARASVPALVALILVYVVVARIWRAALQAGPATEALPAVQVQPWLLAKSLLAVAGVILGMVLLDRHRELAALLVAALLLPGRHIDSRALFRHIDGHLLLLIASLFVVTAAFASLPATVAVATALQSDGFGPERLSVLVPLALVGSNTIGNVPLVMLLVQVLGDLGTATLTALAVFSTLAGNLLLIGSLANIITAERAAACGVRLGFMDFARVGIPVTVGSTALAVGWFLLLGWYW